MNVVYAILAASLELVSALLSLYMWIVIIGVVMSWLVSFDVVNRHNRFVQIVGDFSYRATEPLFSRIRKIIPLINGVDLSPLVVILAIMFLQSFIRHLAFG
ncbi:MAG: YggT family protein [Alphaproteobacteria bacterium]|nr:YggT family protein [Alphaproteobacteria bacterium]